MSSAFRYTAGKQNVQALLPDPKSMETFEGVHGKRPQVTSDRLQNSLCKLLFTSFYEQGEFNLRSKVTYLTLSIAVPCKNENLTCADLQFWF